MVSLDVVGCRWMALDGVGWRWMALDGSGVHARVTRAIRIALSVLTSLDFPASSSVLLLIALITL